MTSPALWHPHNAAQADRETKSYMSPGGGGLVVLRAPERTLHLALL